MAPESIKDPVEKSLINVLFSMIVKREFVVERGEFGGPFSPQTSESLANHRQ